MTQTIDEIDPSYTFRFGSSDKFVHLTQKQLDCIPYLVAFVTHKDDFSSIQNENGEYILNNPIEYTWFMPILHSITSEQPYTLFSKLPDNENVLNVLQLVDYLGIQPFALPLLRDTLLLQSNPTNTKNREKQHVEYHKANILEARQTAAEFVIALTKNEYELHDSSTKKSIFNLINIIFFNTNIFNLRFRRHTLTVVKKYCYPFFSLVQQRQLETTPRIAERREVNSSIYISDNKKPLPDEFDNTFTWRGVYVSIKENNPDLRFDYSSGFVILGEAGVGKSFFISYIVGSSGQTVSPACTYMNPLSSFFPLTTVSDAMRWIHLADMPEVEIVQDHDEQKWPMSQFEQELRKNEAKSARSKHFNTLSKRPTIDKFKHRCGPKAQKYR